MDSRSFVYRVKSAEINSPPTEMEIQQILFYGIILGVLAYIFYARYIKNKAESVKEPVKASDPEIEPEPEVIKTTKDD